MSDDPPVQAPLSLLDAADLIAAKASDLPPEVVNTAFASGWNGAVNALREIAAQTVPEQMPTGDDFVTRFSTPSLIEERGNL